MPDKFYGDKTLLIPHEITSFSLLAVREGREGERGGEGTNPRLASGLAALVVQLDGDLCRRPSSGAGH